MGKNDFVCFKPLTEKLCKCQKDINGEKVDFQKAGAFRFTGGHKVHIRYRYIDLPDWQTVSFQRGKGRTPLLGDLVFGIKYPNGKAITWKKLQDILSLLKSIPPVHHDFYQNLRSETGAEENESDIECIF
jgi:hypothetical protein